MSDRPGEKKRADADRPSLRPNQKIKAILAIKATAISLAGTHLR
jgi:hypothetical protein